MFRQRLLNCWATVKCLTIPKVHSGSTYHGFLLEIFGVQQPYFPELRTCDQAWSSGDLTFGVLRERWTGTTMLQQT